MICMDCDTPITDATAVERLLGKGISEMVCARCAQ